MQIFPTCSTQNLPEGSISPKMGAYQPPIYGGKDRQPEATIDLMKFINRCISTENKRLIEELRSMKDSPNNEQQTYKAKNLPFVTPHGVFPTRNNQTMPKPSWLACIDIDHVEDAPCLKARLIADKALGVVAAVISPRGEGVKVFTVVPHPSSPVSLEGLKMIYNDYYVGIGKYIAKAYGIQIDSASKNLSHACYLTYDPDAYLVEDGTDITLFDPLPWLPPTYLDSSVVTTQSPSTPQPHSTNLQMTDAEKIEVIRQTILESGIDITAGHNNWIRIGFAIFNTLGEAGLPVFLDISKFYPGYSPQKATATYYSLKSTPAPAHPCSPGTLIFFSRQHGLDISFTHRKPSEKRGAGTAETAEIAENSIASTPTYFPSAPSLTPELQLLKQAAEAFGGVSEYISPEVESSLPEIFRKGLSYFDSPTDKDVALLSMITCLSATTPNYYGNYGDKLYSPHLYTCIPGEAGCGKGVMDSVRKLVQQVHQKLRERAKVKKEEYEQLMAEYEKAKKTGNPIERPEPPTDDRLLVGANSSAAAFNRLVADNPNGILLFESELSNLANIFERDYGHFSETLRKSFHHEFLSSHLRTEDYELDNPRLAVLLSGTPDQIRQLIKDPLNGLFSRFLFYSPSSFVGWLSQRPTPGKQDEKAFFCNLGEECVYSLFRVTDSACEPRYFEFDEEQWNQHDTIFTPLLNNCSGELRNMSATIKRLGLIMFRIAMVLSIYRKWEGLTLGSTITCCDIDFQIATVILHVCLSHTVAIYNSMPHDDKSSYSKAKDLFFALLPKDVAYTTETWQLLAEANKIEVRTAERYHSELIKADKIRRIKNGVFLIDTKSPKMIL